MPKNFFLPSSFLSFFITCVIKRDLGTDININCHGGVAAYMPTARVVHNVRDVYKKKSGGTSSREEGLSP